MTTGDEGRGPRKRGAARRAERLEAQLKANLKKRKEQARARARASETGRDPAPPAGDKREA